MKTDILCQCGSSNAKWFGDRHGRREYLCPSCYRIQTAIAFLRSDYVQDNKHRMGVLGQQDIDNALLILTTEDI